MMYAKQTLIILFIADAFADLVLVVVPLLLLQYLQSAEAKAQKVRLAASFVVGGLTTVVSIVHAIYLLQNTRMSIVVTNVEVRRSLSLSEFFLNLNPCSSQYQSSSPTSLC